MSTYEKVRSSSPPVQPTQSNHEPATSRRDSLEVGEESHTRLLAWDEISDEPKDEDPLHPPHRTPWLRMMAFIAAGLVVLGVMIPLGHRMFVVNSGASTTRSWRRHSSDYVVNSEWKYDDTPQVRKHEWVIEDIVGNPDGVFRPLMVINGQFPGPMLTCNEGDTLIIDVVNKATNATSIHWHGIYQNGTNWMDGPVGVTQCPIAPGHSHRYEFTIDGQSGTYFYHAHQGAQAIDGLVGPLVVLGKDEHLDGKPTYASDRVVMIQDWYHDLSDGLLRETLSPGVEGAPEPDSSLINGANVVDCGNHQERMCDNATAVLPTLSLADEGEHRLRILNVGGLAWFEVTVDQHRDLPIVEVDGTSVEPTADSSIMIAPGQRYSIVVTANDTGSEAFWLRARMMPHCYGENVRPKGIPAAKAVVRHVPRVSSSFDDNSLAPLPTTENDSGKFAVTCKESDIGTYRPVHAMSAPESADHSWLLRVNVEIGDWRLERSFLNQSSFRPKLHQPTLHRLVDGLHDRNGSFETTGVNDQAFDPAQELVISSDKVEVVDIILQNFDEGSHPMHLHGHKFWVLAAGHAYFPGYETLGLMANGKGLLNPQNRTIINNPLRRDVTTVEPFGWTLIRFVADNPGVWLFHCHMTWHGQAGMAMQFASRLDMLRSWTIPAEQRRLCQAPYSELAKGATPDDSIWYGFSRDRRR